MKRVDIAVFAPSFGFGGAEKMTINLCRGFSEANLHVDLLIKNTHIPFKELLNNPVRIIELKRNKNDLISQLSNYLTINKPKILLSTKGGDKEAIEAKYKTKLDVKVVLRHGTTFSKRDEKKFFLKRIISHHKLKKIFPKADLIVAVSKGVAKDIIKITKVPEQKVKVLPNPTIVPEMFEMAKQSIDHPWFVEKKYPIILGAGGLRKSKDFPTLIRAFKILRSKIPAKLVILGEGRQRKKIESLVYKLGLTNDVWLPGFRENPYSFMKQADLFVLSSLWEGSPNVLIEAMALGTPVVSTDCPSGPGEILENGKYGKLVPPAKPHKLAKAILETLKNPKASDFLKKAVKKYSIENSIHAYLKALGFC